MKLSINQAAAESGYSKSTIKKACDDGRLSWEPGPRNSKLIERSELHRVFPANGNVQSPGTDANGQNKQENSPLQVQLEAKDAVIKAKDDHIEDLTKRLDKSEEQRVKLTALITDQSKTDGIFYRLFFKHFLPAQRAGG